MNLVKVNNSDVQATWCLSLSLAGYNNYRRYSLYLFINPFLKMIKEKTDLQATGMFFIRVLLGVIFFMQGYGKVFTIGVSRVYDLFFKTFETTFLPRWLIVSTNYFTSYAELICGLLLIIGLFKRCAIYLLALDLLIVSFGHGLMEPIWDLSHVIPRAILLAALFLLPLEWDRWNMDAVIKTTTRKAGTPS